MPPGVVVATLPYPSVPDRTPARTYRSVVIRKEADMVHWMREFFETQVRLWARYGRRHELSGLETRRGHAVVTGRGPPSAATRPSRR